MIILQIITALIFCLRVIFIMTKKSSDKIEKNLRLIGIISCLLFLSCVLLVIFDLRLKGNYTSTIIGLCFMWSETLLFGITKNTTLQTITGLIAIPIGSFSILGLIWNTAAFPLYVVSLPFHPPLKTFKINNVYQVDVRVEGFLSCGESLIITKSLLGILDQNIHVENNVCVTGIKTLEVINSSDNDANLLVYHDGERAEMQNPIAIKIKL